MLRGEPALGLDQLVDPLLDGARADHPVHLHHPRLADPVRAVGCLILDRRVPPAVEVEDVAGVGQVEAQAARPQRHHQHARLAAVQPGSRSTTRSRSAIGVEPSRYSRSISSVAGQVVGQHPAHHRVLREHQRAVALVDGLRQHLGPAGRACPSGRPSRPGGRAPAPGGCRPASAASAAPARARGARSRPRRGPRPAWRRSWPGRARPARPSACSTRSTPAAAAGRAAPSGSLLWRRRMNGCGDPAQALGGVARRRAARSASRSARRKRRCGCRAGRG